MSTIASHHDPINPVHRTPIPRDDGSIEYVLRGPTEGSLMEPIERVKRSFPRSHIVVGRPCMVPGGDVEVRILVSSGS